jgi:hypothetical protein
MDTEMVTIELIFFVGSYQLLSVVKYWCNSSLSVHAPDEQYPKRNRWPIPCPKNLSLLLLCWSTLRNELRKGVECRILRSQLFRSRWDVYNTVL